MRRFFESVSPDGERRVDRLAPAEREVPAVELLGARGYFTDANGCIRRDTWRQVQYPTPPTPRITRWP